MGSKKYKGKPCAYCAVERSTTADHVFSREFFPVGFRDGLPQAPACENCNARKSGLETYLTAILPFGSDHPAALPGQQPKVGRRLAKQPALRRRLKDEASIVWIEIHPGVKVPTVGLPLDPIKVLEYLNLAIRGLVSHEWGVVVPPEYLVEVLTLPPKAFEAFSATILALGTSTRVQRTFAKGALRYLASRAIDDPAFSTWHVTLYDGLGLANPTHGTGTLEIVSITAPPEAREILERLRGVEA